MSYVVRDGKKLPIYFTNSGCRTAAQGVKLYADDHVPTSWKSRKDDGRKRQTNRDQQQNVASE